MIGYCLNDLSERVFNSVRFYDPASKWVKPTLDYFCKFSAYKKAPLV